MKCEEKGVLICEWMTYHMCIWDGHGDTKEKTKGVESER